MIPILRMAPRAVAPSVFAEAARKDDRSGGAAAHRPFHAVLYQRDASDADEAHPETRQERPYSRNCGMAVRCQEQQEERAERKDETPRPHRAADAEGTEEPA